MTGLVLLPMGGWWLRRWRQELGSVLLLIALTLPVLLLVIGLALDVHAMMLFRAEAQVAADAAALAGAVSLRLEDGEATDQALFYASQNRVCNQAPTVNVIVGADQVQVTVETTCPTFLLAIAGQRQYRVRAHATAALVDDPVRVALTR